MSEEAAVDWFIVDSSLWSQQPSTRTPIEYKTISSSV